jgi:hypothetical protein
MKLRQEARSRLLILQLSQNALDNIRPGMPPAHRPIDYFYGLEAAEFLEVVKVGYHIND